MKVRSLPRRSPPAPGADPAPVPAAGPAPALGRRPTPVADTAVNVVISVASFLAWLVPMSVWSALAALGGAIGLCGPTRRVVLRNIAQALRDDPPSRVRAWWIGGQQIATHLRTVVLLLRFRSTPAHRRGRLAFDGEEHLVPHIGRRGIVIVGPHAGPYPLMGPLALPWLRAHGLTGEVVIVARLFRPFRSGAVLEWFSRTLGRDGAVILPVDTPPRALALRLRRTLASGGIVVLLVDEPTAFRSATVPFFGSDIAMPEGPVRLAHATGSVIVPCIARYERRRVMRISIAPAIEPAASALDSLTAVARALEPMIRANLAQWTMLTPIWPDAPPPPPADRLTGLTGRADLHLHTPGSDGLVTVDEWRQAAARRGLDVIAITDHDHLDTIRLWVAAGERLPVSDPGSRVAVVPGVELTARGRATHVGVLFPGPLPDDIPPAGRPLPEIVAWARTVPGAIVTLVHPLPLLWRWQLHRLAWRGLLPDAIETRFPYAGHRSAAIERAARRRVLAALGSSDAHLHPDHIGSNQTAFAGHSVAELVSAIQGRRTTAVAVHEPRRGPRRVAVYQALSAWLLPLRWLPGVTLWNRVLLRKARRAAGLGDLPDSGVTSDPHGTAGRSALPTREAPAPLPATADPVWPTDLAAR